MDLATRATLKAEEARALVTLGERPTWVAPCPFDSSYRAEKQHSLTYLLIDRHVNAETRQTYLHHVVRLETMHAVQHVAQWKLSFDPRTQRVVLHTLLVRRDGVEVDQAKLERFHFLQREQGLEGLTLDGWLTALLVLEDIRPGDTLDYDYTIETKPLLLAQYCTELFALPTEFPVGRFRFSVTFAPSRGLAWKASSPELSPEEEILPHHRRWVWNGQERPGHLAEEHTPAWHMDYPWIQVSDCADWKTIGMEIAEVWRKSTNPDVAALLEEIKAKETNTLQQVEMALRLVQDQHRYLSHNIELGGQMPSAPAVVARRRFGDCKDLSFLLVHLLRGLGLVSRPILVSTKLGKGLREMLPSAGLFDHAIVEFILEGHVRWVDPTVKFQGGGPLKRALWPLHCGLPLDAACEGLAEPPRQEEVNAPYELRETLLLGTDGKSVLDVRVHVRGFNADQLRGQLERIGIESMSKERLETCANRFGSAIRLGNLNYRDDRSANELVLAEAFEVDGFLRQHPNPQLRVLLLPVNLPATILPVPTIAPRRTPFALPYPCDITHTIHIESPAISSGSFPKADLHTPWLKFARRQRSMKGLWSFTFSLRTLSHAVPPQDVPGHRKFLEKIWQECAFNMVLPTGYRRPNRTNLGQLPLLKVMPSKEAASPTPLLKNLQSPGFNVSAPVAAAAPRTTQPPNTSPKTTEPVTPKARRHSRKRRSFSQQLPVGEGRVVGRALLVLFVIIWLAMMIFIVISMKSPGH